MRQSESELQALIEEVVVSESWFFRDERPYQWFREYVRRALAERSAASTASGFELAVCWRRRAILDCHDPTRPGLPARRFQIDAVDISAHRLAIARRGVYSSNAFRGSDLSFRARYFREHPQGYELDSSIRSTVRFLQASVLDPRLLEGSPPYDVVFCRNLLIYLEVSARMCVLATIERLLAADGLLFIGHADRLDIAGVEPKFIAVGDPACFVYRLREPE